MVIQVSLQTSPHSGLLSWPPSLKQNPFTSHLSLALYTVTLQHLPPAIFVYYNISTIEGWLTCFIHCFICLVDISAVNEECCLPSVNKGCFSFQAISHCSRPQLCTFRGFEREKSSIWALYRSGAYQRNGLNEPRLSIFPYREKCSTP